jgi:hypothetical protein
VGDAKNGSGSASSTDPNQASTASADDGDLGDNSFGMRKWFAIAMLVLGGSAIGYFFMKTKKVVKDAKEASK